MSWLSDLLDTKVSTEGDPLGQEYVARQQQRDADTKRLQLEQQNRDAVDAKLHPSMESTVVPPGLLKPTEEDKAAGAEMVAKGVATQAQVDDPYGIRGGKPLPSPTDAGVPLGPEDDPSLHQAAPPVVTPEAQRAAAPMAQSSHVRGGSPGAQPGGPVSEAGELSSAPVKVDDDVEKALVSSGVDPRVSAMLADAARRKRELADAQQEQGWRQNIVIGGNGIYTALGLANPGEMAARQQWANQPVSDVKARQEAGDTALTEAEKQRQFTRSLDADNKNSELSHETARILGLKPGTIAASLAPDAMKMAEQRLKAKEEQGRNLRADQERATQLETTRMHGESAEKVARIGADSRITAAELRAENAGRKDPTLVAAQEKQLSDIRAARVMIQKLDKEMDEKGVSGPSSALSALLGKLGINTDAAQVDANAQLASRVVGRGVEGGKFSDQDAAFYKGVGARAGDARELQRAKNRAALQRLDEAEKQILGVAQQAGRNTGTLTPESSGAGRSAADAPVGTRRPGPGGQMYRKVGPGQWQAE